MCPNWKAYYTYDRLLYYNFGKAKTDQRDGNTKVHPIFRVLFKCPNRIRKSSERPLNILPFHLKRLPSEEPNTVEFGCFGGKVQHRSVLEVYSLAN